MHCVYEIATRHHARRIRDLAAEVAEAPDDLQARRRLSFAERDLAGLVAAIAACDCGAPLALPRVEYEPSLPRRPRHEAEHAQPAHSALRAFCAGSSYYTCRPLPKSRAGTFKTASDRGEKPNG